MAEALAWYADISPIIAKKWYNQVMDCIATLEQYPGRCPKLEGESEQMKKNIRQLLFGDANGQYRILFETQGDTVNILSLRHSSRRRSDV